MEPGFFLAKRRLRRQFQIVPALLFLLTFFLSFALGADDDVVRAVSSDRQWLRLLHYSKHLTGGFRSEIDAPVFFVSKDGARNPESELREWLRRAEQESPDAPEEESVVCRFPARAKYLREKFPDRAREWRRECSRLSAWMGTVSGTSVSLVFSSFYLNNPSSAFGHTLLRINKSPLSDGRRHELLDYGVNFAANSDDSTPVVYAIKGLFGGYPGTFTITPYYYKVREYNNAESRDLWEYELSLPSESVHTLALHFWELGPAYADYWYLTENCSYHMLTVLDAADPSLELVSRLKTYVIPADTLKVVYETPGLVKRVSYRPSIRAEFLTRWDDLSEAERRDLDYFARNERWPDDWGGRSTGHRRRVTDATLDWIDYKEPVGVQKADHSARRLKDRVLMERAKVVEISPRLQVPTPESEAPHLAHGSRRWGLGAEARTSEGRVDPTLSYRFALHDFLDPAPGLPDSASIRFFDTRIRWRTGANRFAVDDFTLFEVNSMASRHPLIPSTSWRMRVAIETENTRRCIDCARGLFSGAAGASWDLATSSRVFFGAQGLVAHRHERAKSVAEAVVAEVGPGVSLLHRFSMRAALFLDAGYRWSTDADLGDWSGALGAQMSSSSGGLRVSFAGSDGFSQGRAEWFFYY